MICKIGPKCQGFPRIYNFEHSESVGFECTMLANQYKNWECCFKQRRSSGVEGAGSFKPKKAWLDTRYRLRLRDKYDCCYVLFQQTFGDF